MNTENTVHTSRPARGEILLVIAAAILLPLSYALFTNNIWEDFLITFKHSQNLCEGNGLVYHPGERIHGFTSPLGVLLPALCYVVTGMTSYMPALWLFRFLGVAALAVTGVLIWFSQREDTENGRWMRCFAAAFCILNIKAAAFAMNGMETAFLLLFLAWWIYLFQSGLTTHWLAGGITWAGLMWTRPDGCVYIAILGFASLIFGNWGSARARLIALLKMAAVCAVLYLPWFVGAWIYYGSPVPHTVIAKKIVDGSTLIDPAFWGKLASEFIPGRVAAPFNPTYHWLGGWPRWVEWFSGALGTVCALYWLLPTRDGLGRLASLSYMLLCAYYSLIACAPWYLPPAAMLGFIVLARGLFTLAEMIQPYVLIAPRAAVVACALIALESLYLFGATTWQMRIQQQEIETGNRAQIGAWLKDHVQPGERVYIECLGYIGYFSGAHMLDYPGLVSPEVVRLRKEQHLNFASVVAAAKPEWLVLRPQEVWQVLPQKAVCDSYDVATIFDVNPRLDQYKLIPGRGFLKFDACFAIFKKKN